MKIQAPPTVVNWLTNGVKEKSNDGQGNGSGSSYDQNASSQREQKQNDPETVAQLVVETKDEEVQLALEKFQNDPHTSTAGLQAEAQGTGPGLRVLLKDVEGKVVRQFSAQEFVSLGDRSASEGRPRGRLLDKKY